MQAAVLRKEGRLQITGSNLNIPKKLLRAQWPELLDLQAPYDVQAHVFVDDLHKYIACAARIILTKAKVRQAGVTNQQLDGTGCLQGDTCSTRDSIRSVG